MMISISCLKSGQKFIYQGEIYVLNRIGLHSCCCEKLFANGKKTGIIQYFGNGVLIFLPKKEQEKAKEPMQERLF